MLHPVLQAFSLSFCANLLTQYLKQSYDFHRALRFGCISALLAPVQLQRQRLLHRWFARKNLYNLVGRLVVDQLIFGLFNAALFLLAYCIVHQFSFFQTLEHVQNVSWIKYAGMLTHGIELCAVLHKFAQILVNSLYGGLSMGKA